MFTGIVEEVGSVDSIQPSPNAYKVAVRAEKVLKGTRQRDSIAVNGVCLTVVDLQAGTFNVQIMPETFKKTNLSFLRKGSKVNLERALSMGDRLGGHLISGDIDGVGQIREIRKGQAETLMQIQPPPHLMKYIAPQGRIAVEGVSLTIAEVNERGFLVYLTPFTLENTILDLKKEEDLLNLEVDLISRYLERIIQEGKKNQSGIDAEFLKKAGY
jgi:riboflavin synthase